MSLQTLLKEFQRLNELAADRYPHEPAEITTVEGARRICFVMRLAVEGFATPEQHDAATRLAHALAEAKRRRIASDNDHSRN